MKMKTTPVIFLVLTGLLAVNGAPAQSQNQKDDAGLYIVPLEYKYPIGILPKLGPARLDDEIADGPSFFNPFADLVQNLEAMMAGMRQQFNQVLKRLPAKNVTGDVPEILLPQFGNVDLDKVNSTSETKVINGHKVVVNETQYKSGGENSGTFFRVRVVDIHPEESAETTEENAEVLPSTTTTDSTNIRDIESVEASVDNEIPKTQDNKQGENYMNLETFDEVDLVPRQNENFEETNDIDGAAGKPVDLTNDIYVNQLMADAGAPINPDAEVFDPIDAEIKQKYDPNRMKFERLVDPR